ncbi:hypothetical protein CVT26_011958 [Gymnopilus dilepis]|uniref:DUF6533 domain-containing protein n=1 Tax=Gymnopilus dilepis TaxID=231916 RepID=A0A409YHU9_9AGAR|nr:hypothetical protein CVT26_011958 [Gymnopilus dilepis]
MLPLTAEAGTTGFLRQWEEIQTARYARLASNVIIFYDYVITLEREINLIWTNRNTSRTASVSQRSPRQFPTLIFLINRYYILASAILFNFLNALGFNFFQWEGWTGLIGCVLTQVILQIRLHAIYGHSRTVLQLMVSIFLACSTTSAVIMGVSLTYIRALPITIPNGEFCGNMVVPPHFYAFWIPLLLFECFLCFLVGIRAYQDIKEERQDFKTSRVFDSHRLSLIVYRDSVLYFLAIGAIYLSSLVVWILDKNTLLEAPIGFAITVASTLGSRLILNLREAEQKREQKLLSGLENTQILASEPIVFNYQLSTREQEEDETK